MKIFGIGLSKTGTTSLARALEILGYRTRDYLGVEQYRKGDLSCVDLEAIEANDAFTDTPIPSFYRELDARFPGSRFILTVREEPAWLQSCKKQFTPRHAEIQNEANRALLRDLYGTDVFDEEKFRAGYRKFVEGVRAYFADRPDDLLILDITGGDGWDQLCAFLGKPVPDLPFPRANVTRIRWIDDRQIVTALEESSRPLARALEWIACRRRGDCPPGLRLTHLFSRDEQAVWRRARRKTIAALSKRLATFNQEIPLITDDRIPPFEARKHQNHLWLLHIPPQLPVDTPPERLFVGLALVEDRRPITGFVHFPAAGRTCYGNVNRKAFVIERPGAEPEPLRLTPATEPQAELDQILFHRQVPGEECRFAGTTEFQSAPLQVILECSGFTLHDDQNNQLLAYNKPHLENPPFHIRPR